MKIIISKSLPKYLFEFVLVFSSIIAAFYVEDYREYRKERQQYIGTLIDFRTDYIQLTKDIFFESDSVKLKDNDLRGSFVFIPMKSSERIYQKLNNNELSMKEMRRFLNTSFWSLQDYITTSPLVDKLKNDYSNFTSKRMDTVFKSYTYITYNLRDNADINYTYQLKLKDILSQLDVEYKFNKEDSLVIYSNLFRNTFKVYKKSFFKRFQGHQFHLSKGSFFSIPDDLERIDQELIYYGIDPTTLEVQPAWTIEERFSQDLGRPFDPKKDKVISLDNLVNSYFEK